MKLRAIRLEKGLSVPALSRLSNVPVRTIEDIEKRGDCKVSTAILLADALEVSLDTLCAADTADAVLLFFSPWYYYNTKVRPFCLKFFYFFLSNSQKNFLTLL